MNETWAAGMVEESRGSLRPDQIPIYNPGRLTDEEVTALFVARRGELDALLEDLRSERLETRAQHHLVIGQRGMGKTTLLRRLAVELRSPPLVETFVPLAFDEEQYEVDRLSKFWLNCLDALADELERVGAAEFVASIDGSVRELERSLSPTDEPRQAERVLSKFLAAAEQTGRRPVLLVDNVQLVFDRLGRQSHALREVLQRKGGPVLVAASPSPPEQTDDYNSAFYDHFKTHYLRGLDAAEMQDLVANLATLTGRDDVAARVRSTAGRFAALHQLTGGNPRTASLLFHLYAEDFTPTVFGDLEQLLDRVTPLYKARFEELSDQGQVVVSAMASHWGPIGSGELAEVSGLKPTTVSSQLDRLRKSGVVEPVPLYGTTRSGYQIAERFFNIWLLMRSGSRRKRRKIEFLTRFLESFYDVSERHHLAMRVASEKNRSPDRALFAMSLSSTLEDSHFREDLERSVQLDVLTQESRLARRKLEEVLDLSTLPEATVKFADLRRQLVVTGGGGAEGERFATSVLRSRDLFVQKEREKLAARGELEPEEKERVLAAVSAGHKRDAEEFGAASLVWFEDLLESGQLRSVDDVDDWRRTMVRSDVEKDPILIRTVPLSVARELSTPGLRPLIDRNDPGEAGPHEEWLDWGYTLAAHLGAHELAVDACRRSLALSADSAIGWFNLASSLYMLGRFEESGRCPPRGCRCRSRIR